MSKKVFFFNLIFNSVIAVACFHDVVHDIRAFDISTAEEWLAGINLFLGLTLTFSVLDLIRKHAKGILFPA